MEASAISRAGLEADTIFCTRKVALVLGPSPAPSCSTYPSSQTVAFDVLQCVSPTYQQQPWPPCSLQPSDPVLPNGIWALKVKEKNQPKIKAQVNFKRMPK